MFNLEEYKKDMKSGPDHIHLIAHYWDVKGKDFVKQQAQESIRRNVKVAQQLLELEDGNLKKAKENLTIIGNWAEGRGLEWTVETVLKKYLEIDTIKQERDKKLNDIRNGNYAK